MKINLQLFAGDPEVPVTYKHILKDNCKVQVDSAIRDGNGKRIDTNYQTKLPTTTTAGQLLKSTSTSGTFALGNSLPYLTVAPSAANDDGLIFVVLSSEPATKYSGYIYIITSS